MPKEQQNKIDEEFDKLLWSIKPEEAENENEVIKDFIHSKLQEAYELGRGDERGILIRCIENSTFNAVKLNKSERYINNYLKQIINKIKSLQTNKE